MRYTYMHMHTMNIQYVLTQCVNVSAAVIITNLFA